MSQPARSDQADALAEGVWGDLPVLHSAEAAQHLFDRTGGRNETMDRLEALLPAHLQGQRWFGAKDQTIRRVAFQETVGVQEPPQNATLSILRVELTHRTEFYLLPLMLTHGDEAARILEDTPQAALAWLEMTGEARSLLHDATASPAFWRLLFRWWQAHASDHPHDGPYLATLDAKVRTTAVEHVRIFWGEQSNSLAFFDDDFCLKLYRRLEQGVNPEIELLDHLTRSGFAYAPRLYGTLTLNHPGQRFVLGTMQEALAVETDGWTYALAMTQRFLHRVAGKGVPEASAPPPPEAETAPAWLEQAAPEMLSLARVLGARTAELHRVLAAADTPDLRPEPGALADTAALLERLRSEGATTRRMLDEHHGALDDLPDADAWQHGLHRLDRLTQAGVTCLNIRIHGDYHLGQVVHAGSEFYLLDFEGEPARSLDERRARDCNLRDVAGMLRSLEYAALSAWQDFRAQHPDEDDAALGIWAVTLVRWCEALFMNAYFETATSSDLSMPAEARRLFVWAYLLQKALYEVRYELSHRPAWTWLPLRGLKRLLEESD